MYVPNKGKFPDEFADVGDDVIKDWDKSGKSGKMIAVGFPDSTVSTYLQNLQRVIEK
jgi:hypothetical protein